MQVSRLACLAAMLSATLVITSSAPAPQAPDAPAPTDAAAPMPYSYEYKVEDPEKELYHGKEEKGDASGRVEGKYYVWLPDKRLMTVTYYVDGESGYVPTITFEDNANPFGAGRR